MSIITQLLPLIVLVGACFVAMILIPIIPFERPTKKEKKETVKR